MRYVLISLFFVIFCSRAAGEEVLWFDGAYLQVLDTKSGDISKTWPAFSGKPGLSASPENQKKKDAGSIPHGKYRVNPNKTQSADNPKNDWKEAVKWSINSSAWGYYYTPIEITDSSTAHGRDGFHLHGGAIPGSIGCIDLVALNKDFHEFLIGKGKVWDLYVYYVASAIKFPRTHSPPWNCPNNPGLHCLQNSNCLHAKNFPPHAVENYKVERDLAKHDLLKEIKK